ncbi:Uncharacterised protein [Enterobacter hormaechei]|nr:Uncharacterised protein [Enterobacter hormaechei]
MILVGHRREIPAMSCCASQPAPLTCLASRDSPLDTEQYRQQLQSCPDNHPVVSTPISDCGTVILQSIIPAVPAAAHAEHHSILSGQNPVRQAAILGSLVRMENYTSRATSALPTPRPLIYLYIFKFHLVSPCKYPCKTNHSLLEILRHTNYVL